MKLNLDRYNDRIKNDLKEIVADIKTEAGSMGIEHRKNSPSKSASVKKIKGSSGQQDGAVNRVSIKFPRVLIYTHKGAGKGKGGAKGSKWLDKYNVEKSTNPESLGKMGTGNRKAKPFINTILDSARGVDKIATTAAEELGDSIVNNMLIK